MIDTAETSRSDYHEPKTSDLQSVFEMLASDAGLFLQGLALGSCWLRRGLDGTNRFFGADLGHDVLAHRSRDLRGT